MPGIPTAFTALDLTIAERERRIVRGNAIQDFAQDGADGIGLHDVGIHRRSHDGAWGQRLNGVRFQMAARRGPMRRGNVRGGDFHDAGGMWHSVQPALQSLHRSQLEELAGQAGGASQGKSPY